MTLKAQDVLVLLKLVASSPLRWSYNVLAVELGMSPSEVHGAVRRAVAARLAVRENNELSINIHNLEEFLLFGVKYVFLPDRGGITRGMLTGHAAPPLVDRFAPSLAEPPPVWPDPQGEARGTAFSPIYKAAPTAARRDAQLYELLVLLDAIRDGRARERQIAVTELRIRLKHYGKRNQSKY